MVAYLNGEPTQPLNAAKGQGEGIVLAGMDEMQATIESMELDEKDMRSCRIKGSSRFDAANGFNYIQLDIPRFTDLLGEKDRLEIYHAPALLAVFTSDAALLEEFESHQKTAPAPEASQALYLLLGFLLEGDDNALQDMEEQIADLEDSMVGSLPRSCTEDISRFRKKLLALKRYYEALMDILEDMEENRNGLFTGSQLRVLRAQTGRVDRLFHDVLNLRDYVTQVRESYQAQLDISLNETMKLLTVVTTVFMPLSLIVGWYGMNLAMPEYRWPYSYPVVIVASVAIAVVCIVYFKRKKWF